MTVLRNRFLNLSLKHTEYQSDRKNTYRKFCIFFIYFVCFIAFSQCITVPIIPPKAVPEKSAQKSIIILQIEYDPGWFSNRYYYGTGILFVKLKEDNGIYLKDSNDFIRSDYFSQKKAVLFNAEPGRYAVAGTEFGYRSRKGINTRSVSYILFTEDFVNSSVFEVGEGEIRVLGKISASRASLNSSNHKRGEADDLQSHNAELLAPGAFLLNLGGLFKLAKVDSFDKSVQTQDELFNSFKEDIQGTEWKKHIEKMKLK